LTSPLFLRAALGSAGYRYLPPTLSLKTEKEHNAGNSQLKSAENIETLSFVKSLRCKCHRLKTRTLPSAEYERFAKSSEVYSTENPMTNTSLIKEKLKRHSARELQLTYLLE
jgi:hypothetical protein